MTDHPPPGPGGVQARAYDPRSDLTFYAILAPSSLAIGLVNTLSVVDDTEGRLPLWQPATWEFTSVVVITLLAVGVMALTRRVWPLHRPRWRVALIHVLAMLAFTVVHVVVAGALRWAVYAAVGDYYDPLGPLFNFVYEARKDVLIYVSLVISYVIWRLYVDRRGAGIGAGVGAPLPTPVQDAIEVRDGARRHFVPLSEVAYIEAAGNYVELHRGQTPILHRAPLSEMERQLDRSGFVRIHRSRLVRRGAIAEVVSKPSGDYVVRLADGRELQGSRRYRRPLLDPRTPDA